MNITVAENGSLERVNNGTQTDEDLDVLVEREIIHIHYKQKDEPLPPNGKLCNGYVQRLQEREAEVVRRRELSNTIVNNPEKCWSH